MTAVPHATSRDRLTEQDRKHIDTYETARQHHQPVCLAAQPRIDSGPRLFNVNLALTRWWALIEQLSNRLPRNPATVAYLDRERAVWFRCRQNLLFAAADHMRRNGMLDAVHRPEHPSSGAVGDVGRFGYFGVAERLTVTEPVEITLRVDVDGTAHLVKP